MTKRDFESILDDCIARLQAGESVDSILESCPQDADRLRPLLRAAAHGRELPKPESRGKARAEGKERILAAAKALRENENSLTGETIPSLSRYTGRMIDWLKNLFVNKEKTDMKLAYRAVLYTLIMVVIGGVFTVNTSAKSLPGEPLYGVKRRWEQARLALAFSGESEEELEEQFEAERLEEVSALVSERRLAEVEFEGTVDSIEGDLWMIGGFDVRVDPDTEITGDPGVGSRVEVEGHTQEDGKIIAYELEKVSTGYMDEHDEDDDMEDEDREEQEVRGTLESLSEDSLIVDGATYVITGASEMEEDLQIGNIVKVNFYEDDNGDLIVLKIELEEQDMEHEDDDLDDENGDDERDDDEMDEEDSEEQEAYGTLESLSEDSLVVNGVTYLLDGDSEMEEELAVGDSVQVEFYENENGDLIILDIELEDEDMDTPSPTDEVDDDDSDDDSDEDDEEDDEDHDDSSND